MSYDEKTGRLTHEFICKETPIYGLDEKSEALILGTIYPSKPMDKFLCKFFYGNDYSIWDILEQKFSLNIDPKNKVEGEVKKPVSNQTIKNMLKEYNIAISDTILETIRTQGAEKSSDNFTDSATVYNEGLIDAIKHSEIKTIFFTSQKARVIFTSKIYSPLMKRLNISQKKYAVDLPLVNRSISKYITGDTFVISSNSIFGKEIKCVILPSPSSRSTSCTLYKQQRICPEQPSYKEWRKCFYENAFAPIFNSKK